MGPSNAGIGAGYNNILSCETQRPYVRGMRVSDAGFDSRRSQQVRRRFFDSLRLRKMILNMWIAFNTCDVWPGCQHVGNVAGRFYQDSVNDVKGVMFKAAFT